MIGPLACVWLLQYNEYLRSLFEWNVNCIFPVLVSTWTDFTIKELYIKPNKKLTDLLIARKCCYDVLLSCGSSCLKNVPQHSNKILTVAITKPVNVNKYLLKLSKVTTTETSWLILTIWQWENRHTNYSQLSMASMVKGSVTLKFISPWQPRHLSHQYIWPTHQFFSGYFQCEITFKHCSIWELFLASTICPVIPCIKQK